MRCQFCGKEIPDDSAFCPECGNVQNREQEPDQSGEMQLFCENCGARIQPGDTFCTVCGRRTKNTGFRTGYGQQEPGYGEQPYEPYGQDYPGNGGNDSAPYNNGDFGSTYGNGAYEDEFYGNEPYDEDPFGEDPDEGKKGSRAPLIIAIVAVCVVLIAAIAIAVKIFIFDRNGDNNEDGRSAAVQDDGESGTDGDSVESEENHPAADVDLTEEDYQTLTGEIRDSSDEEKRLELDEEISIYGRDSQNGEEVMMENADYAVIDESLLPEGMMDDAVYETVSMSGEMTVRDGVLYIRADAVEDGSGEDLIAAYQEKQDAEEGGIHRYELIVKDCTWQEAFEECQVKGGYLARINSPEEMEYIIDQMFDEGLDGTNFFLGGRRNTDSREYFWVDEDNQCYGQKLNDSSYSCYDYWMIGEPSFQDGDIQECYMNLFYYEEEGRTVINDVPNDVISVVPYYSGKVGYICEYED